MDEVMSYNEYLYNKRKEMKMSKRAFAKFLHIPTLFYRYYENGYVKPSKKSIKKISEALNIDYSIYLQGISSYPKELDETESRFVRWYRHLLSKKITKYILLVTILFSSIFAFYGYNNYAYTMEHASEFYTSQYVDFVNKVREKGTPTFSLLHESLRPEIHESTSDKFVSISTSTNDYAIRSLNAYINYKEEKGSTYYIVPNLASESLTTLSVQYVDYATLTKYISSFTIKDDEFILNDNITTESNEEIDEVTLAKVKEKMNAHVNDVYKDFTSMIKNTLNIDYSFKTLLIDHEKGANANLFTEVSSLGAFYLGICFIVGFLFLYLFAIFFGKNKFRQQEVIQEVTSKTKVYKEPKKDIRFFPFIPETVFEIVGIFLILFGSFRVIINVNMLFYNTGMTQVTYNDATKKMFIYFTVGMFLLYFIDFDIYMGDKRSIRNFFMFFCIFFGLYFIETTLVTYLTNTRGITSLITNFVNVPNNFGSIACYFGIMFFLFYTPDFINTKKRKVIFRLLSIIPIIWILFTTYIHLNAKALGIKNNIWIDYFFTTERPQFSFLCITYLVSLYFIRLFIKHKYGETNANKIFTGNRYFFIKNILVCVIISLIALEEYLNRNISTNVRGLGQYYQIIYLVPFLLFYHPHLGKRSKIVDYFTMSLYMLFISIGYIVAIFTIIHMILN